MMESEFGLSKFDYQEDFIRDWWSRKKAFYGSKSSGKTTLLLCELNRFLRNGFKCVWFSPTLQEARKMEDQYAELFGERADVDKETYFNSPKLSKGEYDVVLMDEFQNSSVEEQVKNIESSNVMFVRASICTSSRKTPPIITKKFDFLDSVYRE